MFKMNISSDLLKIKDQALSVISLEEPSKDDVEVTKNFVSAYWSVSLTHSLMTRNLQWVVGLLLLASIPE